MENTCIKQTRLDSSQWKHLLEDQRGVFLVYTNTNDLSWEFIWIKFYCLWIFLEIAKDLVD